MTLDGCCGGERRPDAQPPDLVGQNRPVPLDEVTEYLAGLNSKVRALAEKLDASFVAHGCSAYVKTIYIGYDIGGEMVAALYGHSDHVELALAIPEDTDHPLLVDATHLTWRTLPVAALIHNSIEVKQATPLIELACNRVRAGGHDVHRDNDYFIKARRERLDRSGD